MSIGIRTNDMPMNNKGLVGGLITLGLLTSQVCGYAQTSNFEESSYMIFQDTQRTVNTLSIDSTLVSNQYKPECSKFSAKHLILPGVLIAAGTFGVYSGAFRKLYTNIIHATHNLHGYHFFRDDDHVRYHPAITYQTFGSIGIKSKHSFKERVLGEATAYLTMTALYKSR